jgi:hypothetical protein
MVLGIDGVLATRALPPLARRPTRRIHGIMMSDHLFYPRDFGDAAPVLARRQAIWAPETAWPDVWVTIGAMAA